MPVPDLTFAHPVADLPVKLPTSAVPMGGQGLALDPVGKIPLSLRTGYEFSYDQITASVNVTGTTEGTATTIVSSTRTVFDGAPVLVEFFSSHVRQDGGLSAFYLMLFEGATVLGYLGGQDSGADVRRSVCLKYRFTPSQGDHAYTVKGTTGAGTALVDAGVGGTGTYLPAYLRITKV